MDVNDRITQQAITCQRDHGMTDKAMAELLGISAATYRRRKSGARWRVRECVALAQALSISMDALLYPPAP